MELVDRYGDDAMYVAGGTDLVPNMKHRLFTPGHLVALKGIGDLKGIEVKGDHLDIGAGETLSSVAAHPEVRKRFSSLADAAGHVAGPQLRNAGTIGGNVCLDTRCTYYNQTEFWRKALGYCLKKDGTVCHVTKVGKKCVAAHSADTPPALITLDGEVEVRGPGGVRTVSVSDFFVPDGIWNARREPGEIVTRIRVPLPEDGEGDEGELRTGYAKLRQRDSIDFPLLTVAVAGWIAPDGRVRKLRGVVTALGSRPRELTGWDEIAEGELLGDEVVEALAQRAHKQCRPLDNIIVDPDWRRAMVPVYVRRALEPLREAESGAGQAAA